MKAKFVIAMILMFGAACFATVTSTETKRQYFTCNGSTTTFTFTMECNSSDDIQVSKRLISTGVPTLLVEDTDYTITNTGSSYLEGGVVTIDPALASTYQVVIIREVVQTQETVAGAITPATVVLALDKVTRLAQDARNDIDQRVLRIPDSDPSTAYSELENSVERAGYWLGFDSITGAPFAGTPAATGISVSAFMATLNDDADAATARGTLELDTDDDVEFAEITGTTGIYTDLVTKSPWHDIRAYGAGTGESAATNATAIQAALDAAETAGSGVVFIPAGEFDYNVSLTIASYVGIVGTGPNSSILNYTATDSTNAIECEGTGTSISAGTPKDWVWIREVQIKGNSSSGHGIVFDIARYCSFYNVYSLSHGGDCWHFGAPPAASSYLSRIGRITMINCHSSGGTNSVYAAGGNINILGQSAFNNASAIGIILEDMRISYLNGISGGSSGTHGIEIRSATGHDSGEYDMYSIHLNDIHWEGLSSGDSFVNVSIGGTTELIGLSITSCEYSPRAADGITLAGVVKNVYIEHNYMQSRRTSDAAIGVTIGASCEDIYVTERNYWPYNLNIDNAAGVGVLHCSEEQDRSTTSVASSGTGEDNLNTSSIKASYLETHGGLKIKAAGTKTNSNGNKTIKLHFGASSWTVHATANDTNDWRLEAEIINTATNAQKVSWVCWNGTTVAQGYETAAIDTTAAVTLKLTGECANASDLITQQIWLVERF